MKRRFQCWLIHHLGIDLYFLELLQPIAREQKALQDQITDLARQVGIQRGEDQQALTEVITELNTLRNNLPAVLTNPPKPGVKVLRNFRDFRAAVERGIPGAPQPIPIERIS